MTWGLLRPTILLPSRWASWLVEKLDAVLAHEIAHAARFDVVAHRIARVAAAVYWFNPLAWFAVHQAQLERERACDDLVLRRGTPASSYAGELVEFARALSAPAAVLPMARRSRLEARVMAILDPRTNRNGTSLLVAALAVLLVAVAIVGSVIKLSAYDYPPVPERMTFQAEKAPVPASGDVAAPDFQRTMPPPPPPAPVLRQATTVTSAQQGESAKCAAERAKAVAAGWDVANLSFFCDPGVKYPSRVHEARPQYTPEAMRQKIQGPVELQGIIDVDGRIREPKVTRSLDKTYGLDEEARKAVEAMRFEPATKDGKPVRVLVTIELLFTLHKDPPPAPPFEPPPPQNPPPPPPPAPLPAHASGDLQSVRQARCEWEQGQAIKAGWNMSNVHIACEPGLELPIRTRYVAPAYTPEAMRSKIQGGVTVSAIVDTDGVVREAKVTQSLDRVFGLDEQALKAVRAMTFRPGTLNGHPVRVLMTFDMQFTLR
jgi:TonB family protein